MAHQTRNNCRLCVNIEKFYKSGKYTDVAIVCGDVKFKCHRLVLAAASKYFEKVTEDVIVTLPGTSATTFEQVLQFMYTGDVVISPANIIDLLAASKFLGIPDMEALCFQFVESSALTIDKILDIFTTACKSRRDKFTIRLSRLIADKFEILSRVDRFLEIPFNDFKLILNQVCWSSVRNEESLLGAISRWMHHRREERLQYFDELTSVIRFENISSTYMKFMFTKFFLNSPVIPPTCKPTGYDTVSELRLGAISATEKSLHVFIKHESEQTNAINSSVDKPSVMSMTFSTEIPETHVEHWVRCIALDDFYFYCLHYPSKCFEEDFRNVQAFNAYTSIDMRTKLNLKSPPLFFRGCRTALCGLQNNIYAYFPYILDEVVRTNTCPSFDDDTYGRGIYLYNREINEWFPVPRMRKQLNQSCMTISKQLLYLIGGESSDGTIPSKCVQVYDYRSGNWSYLPNSKFDHSGADCCAIDGKVYVCGGRSSANSRTLERYDPTAEKWEILTPMNDDTVCHRVVSYKKQLWVMRSFHHSEPSANSPIDIYDPTLNTWSSGLTENSARSSIVEAVVFTSS